MLKLSTKELSYLFIKKYFDEPFIPQIIDEEIAPTQ